MGDEMKSAIKGTTLLYHTNSVWSIPKADPLGQCTDFYGAHFMEGEATTCSRVVSLEDDSTDCVSLLDTAKWTTDVSVFGGRNPGSTQYDINVVSLFMYDETTGVYTE